MEHNGTALEAALVAAVEALDGLKDRVCPVIDIQKSTGPLVVYDQRQESDERDISGGTGLLEAVFQIHVLHSTYLKMRTLSENVKDTLNGMSGREEAPLLIEAVIVELATPDIMEMKVQLFRRTYNVRFLYQIKEDK